MLDASLMLPPPHRGDHPQNSMWVDEQIWGHRLWDSQSPWLLFLEFLNIAEACHRAGTLLDGGVRYPLDYMAHKRMYLRNILFNDDEMFRIADRCPDNGTAWSRWLAHMAENAKGVKNRDFSFLKARFSSFHQFSTLVGTLRGSSVESDSNKRWSSRFVFPFGSHALYVDLNISKQTGTATAEYINFGRTGEVLYLMLCGAKQAADLRRHFCAYFEKRNDWDQLLSLFEPQDGADWIERGKSYLPYRWHPCCDRLAEDWLRLLEIGLPGFDVFPHLVTLGALHVLLYQLEVAHEWAGGPDRVSFICEAVAPRKTLVRELSGINYQENNVLPQRAVEACVRQIEESQEWVETLKHPGAFVNCRELLLQKVRWPQTNEKGECDYEGPAEPEELLAEFRRVALSRHRQHVANVHRSYGREIGLVSRRGTNKFRYAPTDALLKSLILANVDRRIEFREFLARIFDRYGLVFGKREAELTLGKEDREQKAFQANADRLEQRLASLGMLRRLSDACAYVLNPFARTQA